MPITYGVMKPRAMPVVPDPMVPLILALATYGIASAAIVQAEVQLFEVSKHTAI
jgi:hypothetical protein